MKYLVVGLGNIGPEYEGTRHNSGFMVVDEYARKNSVNFTEQRYGETADLSIKGRKVILLKPNTFMNLSGNAVRYWMQKEGIGIENLLVVVDDLALPFGQLRLKPKGSAAGHNGLRNIEEMIGTENYARLRFGLGNNYQRGGHIDFVLGKFTNEELDALSERLNVACDMITSFVLAGIQVTMNQFNNK